MNEIFNISRFAKLVRYECMNYLPRHIKAMPVYSGLVVLFWLFVWFWDIEVPTRGLLMAMIFFLALMLTPYIVYGDFNNRKKGVCYAMLPASVLEKFLSMFLMCVIVTPLMTYAGITLTDALLHLLSLAGVGTFTDFEIYNPFTYYIFVDLLDGFQMLLVIISVASYSMMFNALFRRFKIVKSILVHIVLSTIMQFVSFIITLLRPSEVFGALIGDDPESEAFFYSAGICFSILSIALMQAIVYLRIRKVNY